MAATGIKLRRLTSKGDFTGANELVDGELVFALTENEFGFLKDGNLPNNITWGRLENELPIGGITGQVLAKSLNNDYAVEWIDAAAGGGGNTLDISTLVTVGPLGDYATIQAALDFFGGFFPMPGVTGTIQLQDDFVMAEQVVVDSRDWGWITITALTPDTVYNVNNSTMTIIHRIYGGAPPWAPDGIIDAWHNYHPLFLIKGNSVSPNIKCRFNMIKDLIFDNTSEYYTGIIIHNNSQCTIFDEVALEVFSEHCGFTSFLINVFVHDNSTLNAVHCNFSDTTHTLIALDTTSYITEAGVYAADNSSANIENSVITACKRSIYSVSSTINAEITILGQNLTATGSGGDIFTSITDFGVDAVSSTIILDNAIVEDCRDVGIQLEATDLYYTNSDGLNTTAAFTSDIDLKKGSTARLWMALALPPTSNLTLNTLSEHGILFCNDRTPA